MKKIIMTLLMIGFATAVTFANFYDDLRYYQGKKIEVVLADGQKSEIGIYKDTSEIMKNIYAIVIEDENGKRILIRIEEIALIKEL